MYTMNENINFFFFLFSVFFMSLSHTLFCDLLQKYYRKTKKAEKQSNQNLYFRDNIRTYMYIYICLSDLVSDNLSYILSVS